MNIKITTDSTCDLPKELLETCNISILPLTVIRDGNAYRDGVDITPADIFRHVETVGTLCSTSAPNIVEYRDFFARFAEEYDAVIHISLGSGFSTSNQSATLAAEEFDNVWVIDSMSLSVGQGYVALAAWKYAQTAVDPQEVCRKAEAFRSRVEISFLLNRLDYMQKGGRCSAAAALGANLLSLKPCIEVQDNKMVVAKKYRGNYAKCIAAYIKDRLSGRTDINCDHAFITCTSLDEKHRAVVEDSIAQFGTFELVQSSYAGCTVSCHCGPDTVGIIFIRK